MTISTMTSKGQTTVPREIRQRLNLRSGDQLEWRIEKNGGIHVLPKSLRPSDVCGFLASRRKDKKVMSIEEMDKGIAEAVRKRHA